MKSQSDGEERILLRLMDRVSHVDILRAGVIDGVICHKLNRSLMKTHKSVT